MKSCFEGTWLLKLMGLAFSLLPVASSAFSVMLLLHEAFLTSLVSSVPLKIGVACAL